MIGISISIGTNYFSKVFGGNGARKYFKEGETAWANFAETGKPIRNLVSVQWYVDGVAVPGEDGASFVVPAGGELSIVGSYLTGLPVTIGPIPIRASTVAPPTPFAILVSENSASWIGTPPVLTVTSNSASWAA